MFRFVFLLLAFIFYSNAFSLPAYIPHNHFNQPPKDENSQKDFLKDRLLLKLKDDSYANVLKGILKDYGFIIDKFFKNTGIYLIKIPEGFPLDEALEMFKDFDFIKFVEKDFLLKTCNRKEPNDPYFKNQWGLDNRRDTDIDMPEEWSKKKDSEKIIVAVIDTGIDYNHEDLRENIWKNEKECNGKVGVDDDGNGYKDDCHGWNALDENGNVEDDNGHGTHVAGILGAVGNNGRGIAGENWHTNIMALKFMDSNGRGSVSDAIECIEYIIDNIKNGVDVKVVNASWGSYQSSKALYDAIKKLKENDVLFVAAAGNDKNNNDSKPFYPASYDLNNIISVAATDKDDNLASFSNYGKNSVDVAAPGVDILSTVPGNKYEYKSGTSMATPFVSGLAAFIWSYKTSLSYYDVKATIEDNVDKINSLQGIIKTEGRINAEKSIDNATSHIKKEPEIRIKPDHYNYSNVKVGQWKTEKFVISNAGNETLEIFAMYIEGKDHKNFKIVSNNCPPDLEPEQSCDILIRFSPENEGIKEADFVIENNSNENLKKVHLKGKGIKEKNSFFNFDDLFGFSWF